MLTRPLRAISGGHHLVVHGSPTPLPVAPASNPGECATYRYATPGVARSALHGLMSRGPQRLQEARYVLRGAKMAVDPELRDLAQRTENQLTEQLSEKDVSTVLRTFLLEAATIELQIEDMVESLVTLTPLPVEALIAAFQEHHGRLMLGRLKPLDILWVPEEKPSGFPPSAHAFLRLMQWKQGPFYRNSDYIRVAKEEREHFPWVMEQVRIKGQEFFHQYRTAELKTGRDSWSLVLEADAFVTVISEKLFALATIMHMSSILERQDALDCSGSLQHRWFFLQDFSKVPPPLSAVKVAFGIDWKDRRVNLNAENIFKDWQRCNLWRRRRTYKIKEAIFPTVRQLGDMALATHLQHRPFAAALNELYALEEPHLRPWYGAQHPTVPMMNVLFSREMLKRLSVYCADALQAAVFVSQQDTTSSVDTTIVTSPYRVLCVGSGCSRLRHYLHFLLSKLLKGKDVKVAAAVPKRHTSNPANRGRMAWWPPLEDAEAFHPPETSYTLEEVLETYAPRLVICVCMPPGVDWSEAFRRSPQLLEYLLIGPSDSDKSGQFHVTWGGAEGFANRGLTPKVPRYVAQQFVRYDLDELSATVLGSYDAPSRVGTNSVVSFRRLFKPRLIAVPGKRGMGSTSSFRRSFSGGHVFVAINSQIDSTLGVIFLRSNFQEINGC